MRLQLVAALALLPLALVGCGDATGDGATGTDPTPSASPPTSAASSPAAEPVSARATCAELYHPPAQLMQHAIDLIHGSPSAEDSSAGNDLVAGLAGAGSHALAILAVDIETTRTAVAAKLAGQQPDLRSFDQAVNRLARHCALTSD